MRESIVSSVEELVTTIISEVTDKEIKNPEKIPVNINISIPCVGEIKHFNTNIYCTRDEVTSHVDNYTYDYISDEMKKLSIAGETVGVSVSFSTDCVGDSRHLEVSVVDSSTNTVMLSIQDNDTSTTETTLRSVRYRGIIKRVKDLINNLS